MIQMFLLTFILCLSTVVHADVPSIYYDGRPLDIPVAAGKVTEVVFPDQVAKIVKGGGADSILVEVLDYSVFILPKNEHPADIFVTSVKGESYPLNFVMGQGHEAKVKIAYAFDPHRPSGENRSDAMGLMKLLMKGRVPAGATVLQGNENLLIAQGQIQLTLNTVFDLPKLNGLILTARNLTDNTVVVPLQAIAYPRLLAITSDADTLAPKGGEGEVSRIYMVTEK